MQFKHYLQLLQGAASTIFHLRDATSTQNFDLNQTILEQQRQWQILEHEWASMVTHCHKDLALADNESITRMRTTFETYISTSDRLLARASKGIPKVSQSRDCSNFVLQNQQVIYDSSRINTLIYEMSRSLEQGLTSSELRDAILDQWRQSTDQFVEHSWATMPPVLHRAFLSWIWPKLTVGKVSDRYNEISKVLTQSMLRSRSCSLHSMAMEQARSALLQSMGITLRHHRSLVESSMRLLKKWTTMVDAEEEAHAESLAHCHQKHVHDMEDYCVNILEEVTSMRGVEVLQLCRGSVSGGEF